MSFTVRARASEIRQPARVENEEMDTQAKEYRERLDTIAQEIASTSQRLGRLYDALETGKLSLEDLAPRIQELRQRQQKLQASKWEAEALLSDRRVQLADLATMTEYVDDLRNLLTYSSLAEQRTFIRSFVKEVKVTGKGVLLTCTLPLPPQGITQERAGVLNIVPFGGPTCTIDRTFSLTFSLNP